MDSIRRYLPLLLLLGLLACAWFKPLDEAAAPQLEAGLKRALVSFAAARTLNAVISVAQGTEVAASPGGIGLTFAPGQALDPINDLVEQFASLMLAASVAFGLQLMLIKLGSWWGVSLLLSALALGWAWAYLRAGPAQGLLTRALVVVLLVRFAIPLAAIGSDAAFQLFMETDYTSAQSDIERSATRLPGLDSPADRPAAEESVLERTKRWFSNNANVGERVESLKKALEGTVEHMVKVIVVFLLQTLVIPLLLLWAMIRAARALTVGRRR